MLRPSALLALTLVPSARGDEAAAAFSVDAAAAATASLTVAASLEQDFLTAETAALIPDRRFDMCDRAQAIREGKLKVGDALSGAHLNFIAYLGSMVEVPRFEETTASCRSLLSCHLTGPRMSVPVFEYLLLAVLCLGR